MPVRRRAQNVRLRHCARRPRRRRHRATKRCRSPAAFPRRHARSRRGASSRATSQVHELIRADQECERRVRAFALAPRGAAYRRCRSGRRARFRRWRRSPRRLPGASKPLRRASSRAGAAAPRRPSFATAGRLAEARVRSVAATRRSAAAIARCPSWIGSNVPPSRPTVEAHRLVRIQWSILCPMSGMPRQIHSRGTRKSV